MTHISHQNKYSVRKNPDVTEIISCIVLLTGPGASSVERASTRRLYSDTKLHQARAAMQASLGYISVNVVDRSRNLSASIRNQCFLIDAANGALHLVLAHKPQPRTAWKDLGDFSGTDNSPVS